VKDLDLNFQQSTTSQAQEPLYSQIGSLANRLFLLGFAIINSTKDDNLLVLASFINLLASFLLRKAIFVEADAQQIAPGVTTQANQLKVVGSALSLTGLIILVTALLIEVSIRRQNGAPVGPFAAGSVAVT
jgi:uncharacterized membrane protein